MDFWVTAERVPVVQAVYPGCTIAPPLIVPGSQSKRKWERPEAIRELVRGRMEVTGPVTQGSLANYFHLTPSEIDLALLALEGEGFFFAANSIPKRQEPNGAIAAFWRASIA